MKVLFVYSGNSRSGTNPIVESQALSLVEKNIEVSYFPIRGKGIRGYYESIKQLKKHLKRNRYDIIHAHYGLCAFVVTMAGGKKMIASFMGDDLIGENRADGSLTYSSRIIARINAFLAKYKYDYTVVKSDQMAEKLYGGTKFSIIPNGVNISKFFFIDQTIAKEQAGLSKESKIVLFAADRERAEKNFDLAKISCQLLGDEKLELISVNGMDQSILNLYYNSAHLLLLTSYHEGSPNVVKEAMACNCPIVSTDVGDVKWLTSNVEGCFISSYEPLAVSDSIRKAILVREKQICTNGRQKIITLGLDSDSVSERLIEIYRMVN
jgi:teichuronic acid biosynthesis glycosyltransferase TuaC